VWRRYHEGLALRVDGRLSGQAVGGSPAQLDPKPKHLDLVAEANDLFLELGAALGILFQFQGGPLLKPLQLLPLPGQALFKIAEAKPILADLPPLFPKRASLGGSAGRPGVHSSQRIARPYGVSIFRP